MQDGAAVSALSALAHCHRLRIFRTLVCAAPNGQSAGELADVLAMAPSTLSDHLARLRRAGLVRSWRDKTRIFYAADLDGARGLIAFLVRDCCHGRPELCGLDGVVAPATSIGCGQPAARLPVLLEGD